MSRDTVAPEKNRMKALQLVGWGKPAEMREVHVPQPGPGEVVLKITAAGACHSDLHLMDWPEGTLPWKVPFTLGHENAGIVHSVGAGVTGVKTGDAMLVYGPWGCSHCVPCRLGRENYCDNAATIPASGGGLGRDGGMAEYMLVPSTRLLVPLGKLDSIASAPLTDAGLTPYHAIKSALPLLRPGTTAVVIGTGGLGQAAVQLLRALSPSQVIAIDRSAIHLERARACGAHEALLSDPAASEKARALTDGRGAELVLDMVGSNETMALGASLLRAEGRLILIGLAQGTLPFNFFAVPYGAQVSTSYWGTVTELMELVELAKDGHLKLPVQTFPLERAADAYTALRAGTIVGRAVVTP